MAVWYNGDTWVCVLGVKSPPVTPVVLPPDFFGVNRVPYEDSEIGTQGGAHRKTVGSTPTRGTMTDTVWGHSSPLGRLTVEVARHSSDMLSEPI